MKARGYPGNAMLGRAPIFPGLPKPFSHCCRPYSKLPAGLANAGDLALVGQLTEADTANAVVPQVSVGSAADLAAVIAAAGELGLSLLLQDHRLLCHLLYPPKSSGEGSAQLGQQLLGFLVGGSGGADCDIHTTDLVHLVVLDLREDQLLLDT